MKCSHCPRPGFCQGERVPRLCELRNLSYPDHRRHLAPVMGEDGYDATAGHAHAVAIDQPTMSLATGIAIVMCPVRGYPIPCGCQVEKRYCGTTFHVVVLDDCLVCVRSRQSRNATMTNDLAIRTLAPAILPKLDEENLLSPFEDFSIPIELVPISAETLWDWDHSPDPGKIAALRIARFMADLLFPVVE